MSTSKYKARIMKERAEAAGEVWHELYMLWHKMYDAELKRTGARPNCLGPGTPEWAMLRMAEKVLNQYGDEHMKQVHDIEPPARDYSDAQWEKWEK